MKVAFVHRPGMAHRQFWGGAFLEGLGRHGAETTVVQAGGLSRPFDLVVSWGVRNNNEIRQQLKRGGEVCILERGYIGDRHQWTSVSFGGGLNGRGVFRGPLHDPSRWNALWADRLKPWRKIDNGYGLILGQVPVDAAVSGRNVVAWYQNIARMLKQRGIKPLFRTHPLARNVIVPAAKKSTGSLDEALAGARFAVTFNSNSGLDAVLAGVPTITADPGAMAWDVTGHDINEDPPTPDRAAWCRRIAWCQYNETEMRSGECWEHVKNGGQTVSPHDADPIGAGEDIHDQHA